MAEISSQHYPHQEVFPDKVSIETNPSKDNTECEANPEEECLQSTSELIEKFVHESVLVDDKINRRAVILGRIDSKPAVVTISKLGFCSEDLNEVGKRVSDLNEIGKNSIYYWCMCHWKSSKRETKIDLTYPASEEVISRYMKQEIILFKESPETYENYTKPFILNEDPCIVQWMINLIDNTEGHTEEIFFDSSPETEPESGFIIVPDYKWDRTTTTKLHALAIVKDRSLRTLRDLCSSHIPMLQNIARKAASVIPKYCPDVKENELRIFVHYLPTYFHLHVHIVHVRNEVLPTLAVGRAHLLDNIIENLRLCPDYYKRANLVFTLKKMTRLHKILEPLIIE